MLFKPGENRRGVQILASAAFFWLPLKTNAHSTVSLGRIYRRRRLSPTASAFLANR